MCFFKEINFTFMDKIGFLMKKGYFAAFLLPGYFLAHCSLHWCLAARGGTPVLAARD